MRDPERQTFYLVGTPKGRINQHEKKWLDLVTVTGPGFVFGASW
jgi:hypothetical protein